MLRQGLYENSIPSKKQKTQSSSTNRNQHSKREDLNTSTVKITNQPERKLTNICTDQTKICKNFDSSFIATQRNAKPILYKNTYIKSTQGSRQASLNKNSFIDQSESKDSICFSKLNSSQIQYESNRKLNESSNVILPDTTKEKMVFNSTVKPINPAINKPNLVRLTKQNKCGSMNMNSNANPMKKVNNPSDAHGVYSRSISRGLYSNNKQAVSVGKCVVPKSTDKIPLITPPTQISKNEELNNSKPNTNTSINININNFNQKNFHVPVKQPNIFSEGEEVIVCPEQQHFLSVISAKKNRLLAKQFDKVESGEDMSSL